MLTPAKIAETYVNIGAGKAKTPLPRLFALAMLAGAFIAFAGASTMAASATVADPSTAKVITALLFPAGLVMVVLAGSELFTGDCLMVISAAAKKITVPELLRTWCVVYLGNLLGSVLVAVLVVCGHTPDLFGGALAQSMVNTALAKVSISFTDGLFRGILCNVLVCAAVWIAIGGSTATEKIFGLYPPVFLFVLAGYEHCVANMFYVPAGIFTAAEYGIAAEGLNWGSFFLKNLLPVTLGNIIGGAGVVGMGYYYIYLHEKKAA